MRSSWKSFDRIIQWTFLVLCLAAFIPSIWQQTELIANENGIPWVLAMLIPICIDGAIIGISVLTVRSTVSGRPPLRTRWWILIGATVLSVIGNSAFYISRGVASWSGVVAVALAALPPVALLLLFHAYLKDEENRLIQEAQSSEKDAKKLALIHAKRAYLENPQLSYLDLQETYGITEFQSRKIVREGEQTPKESQTLRSDIKVKIEDSVPAPTRVLESTDGDLSKVKEWLLDDPTLSIGAVRNRLGSSRNRARRLLQEAKGGEKD